ncbi:MAG: hypothetical protein IT319_11930 [Anaerolineae bacterium]|nr:hypothetical protein [Anaerolineae bacterium]
MEQRLLISDIHLEGRIPQYMTDLLARWDVLAPDRNSADEIDAARSKAD